MEKVSIKGNRNGNNETNNQMNGSEKNSHTINDNMVKIHLEKVNEDNGIKQDRES